MANILHIDDSEVACRAMRGILTRGNHRCITAANTADAWKILREGVNLDLVMLELKLPGENGVSFIQRLRLDSFFKKMPVVVYTFVAEPVIVKKTLTLKIQDYLIKPYDDERIYAEITKACANPWRSLHFEEEKSFCVQMGLKLDELRQLRQSLESKLDEAAKFFPGCATGSGRSEVAERLNALSDAGQAAGVWAVVDYVGELQARVEANDWNSFKKTEEEFSYASRLIFCHLNPAFVPEALRSEQEQKAAEEARERNFWLKADVTSGPVHQPAEVEKLVGALAGCPVIDTIAASFQMTADGQAASLSSVMDLVARDPGLSAQVLSAANRLGHEEMSFIEDTRAAVSLLGEVRLHAMAKALPTVDQRYMNHPPISWPNFWMFQCAVGKLAQFTANYLEFYSLVENAYTAGLMHDLGKLILLKIYPIGFNAIAAYAKEHTISMHEAEKKYIGCTSREIAVMFAVKDELPPVFTSVIRWVESPTEATEHADLVAIVALARHICLHNHVGYCGDTPKDATPPLIETAAWHLLREKTFPSFDLAKFESQAHDYSLTLRQELMGRQK